MSEPTFDEVDVLIQEAKDTLVHSKEIMESFDKIREQAQFWFMIPAEVLDEG